MHKIDLTITRLKLLLAEVKGKREALAAARRQYEEQIERLIDFTVHEDGAVDRAVSMMIDIDTRIQESARQDHYLERVQRKAQQELDSLQITKLIEETRAQLAALRGREDDASRDDEIAAEIRRLEEIIAMASDVAAKSISAGESLR